MNKLRIPFYFVLTALFVGTVSMSSHGSQWRLSPPVVSHKEAHCLTYLKGGVWVVPEALQKAYESENSSNSHENLYHRYERGNLDLQSLVDNMGWTVGRNKYRLDVKVLQPPHFVIDVLSRLNRFSRKVSEEGRIYAALKFVDQDRNVKWIRPNVDPLPDFNVWSYRDPSAITREEFKQLMKGGVFPLSLNMLDHDFLGHVLNWQQDVEFMAATRRFYKSRPKVPTYFEDAFFEFTSFGDLRSKGKIRKLFSRSFAHENLIEHREVFSNYKNLSDQLETIEILATQGESLIKRTGGASSDEGAEFKYGSAESLPSQRLYLMLTSESFVSRALDYGESVALPKPINELARQSPYYILFELRELYEMYLSALENDRDWEQFILIVKKSPEETRDLLEKALLRKLAVLETLLVNGVKAEMTPGRFLRLTLEDPSSPELMNYLRSYLGENSAWENIISAVKPREGA